MHVRAGCLARMPLLCSATAGVWGAARPPSGKREGAEPARIRDRCIDSVNYSSAHKKPCKGFMIAENVGTTKSPARGIALAALLIALGNIASRLLGLGRVTAIALLF